MLARRGLLWSALGAAAAPPPSDRIRIVLMGVRGRGRSLTQAFAAQPDVDVAYVCDVDSSVVEPALQLIEKSGRPRPPVVSDIRRCL
ncbi:MAG: gfo/Idh/MocA family oxidoreductase, partial [Acidobacteriota bacterium]